jgi:hypothetical protein
MPSARRSLALFGIVTLLLGAGCADPAPPEVGAQLFQSPQVNPIAIVEGKDLLLVANTTSGTLSIFKRGKLGSGKQPASSHSALWAEIRVGVDPVGIAVRPQGPDGKALALVTNHISDSISVVDLNQRMVVQTLQAFDADGVTTTDAPSGVVFAGPDRAFVALDDRDEILVIDFDAAGVASLNPERLPIPGQAPRAMTVVGDRLLVGVFESGNQTEFPMCDPADTELTRPFAPGDPWDEGCLFYNRFIDTLIVNDIFTGDIDIDFGDIVDFAARNPNIGGEVIVDRDRPDRDVIVYDVDALGAPVQVIEGVSTLLYGLASHGGRVWITSAEARNQLDGLDDLENRMFENRLSWLDCTPDCGPPSHVDLDQNAFGVPVPTPYGVRASRNGQQLVVSVSGSDGRPGLAEDPTVDIPGLVTLDADGNVLGHVPTGAIPQGVALASDEDGNAETAYVLNTVDSTVSIVDVSDPASPTVVSTFAVGDDPVPPEVRLGRTMFMSARASTSGNFSCESCHPNGNTDQLIWTINTVESPQDVPECNPFEENCPEPRTTMPIRGLRDTLPLHWVGNLAEPFEDREGQLFQPETDGPDCDLAVDGEIGCTRDLVNASLSGVMCDPVGGCAPGPTGLPGALTEAERDALAAFLMSVSYPPSPTRRPDDALSPTAVQGVSDFFTDADGLGVGSGAAGVGQAVGFSPLTCADNSGGCHALPLTADTNSVTVGGFDAPTMRGLWDRHVQFSNGNPSAEEVLLASQQCADGNPPGDHPFLGPFLTGDPCALLSPVIEGFLGFQLDPFMGVPSGETIYDPARGPTERGVFLSTFESLFQLAYGVRGAAMWEFFSEMSVGFGGLYGRQVTADASNAFAPETFAALDEMIAAAHDGKANLIGSIGDREYRYLTDTGLWHMIRAPWKKTPGPEPTGETTEDLLQGVVDAVQFAHYLTVTVHLAPGVTIGGTDRQPLLDVDPDARAAEGFGDLLAIPRPAPAPGETFRVGGRYVDPAARVLVDGAVCETCSFVPVSTDHGPALDVTLGPAFPLGTHVLQVLNPDGWASNELPMVVEEPPPPAMELSTETIDCVVASGCLLEADPRVCAELAGCGTLGVAACGDTALPNCQVCTLEPDCSDGSCTPVESLVPIDLEPDACPDVLAEAS